RSTARGSRSRRRSSRGRPRPGGWWTRRDRSRRPPRARRPRASPPRPRARGSTRSPGGPRSWDGKSAPSPRRGPGRARASRRPSPRTPAASPRRSPSRSLPHAFHTICCISVYFHPEAPALAADAALLEAAEGRVEEVDAVVDPHYPGADALGERDRPGGVARQHHAAEPVGGVVRDADRLVLVREGDHGHDGPEDLLLRDADPVGHRAEDGRLEEVAAPEVLRPAAAVGEDGALALARLDVL